MKIQKNVFLLSLNCFLLVTFGCNATNTSVTIQPILTETTGEIPTLNAEDAYPLLKNLTLHNQNCRLPCFGGINPGVTSNSEAEIILQPLSRMVYGGPSYEHKGIQFSNAGGGRSFFFDDVEISFVLGWLFESSKDKVEKLAISAIARKQQPDGIYVPVFGDKSYMRLFSEYSLGKVLSIYGTPTNLLTFAYVYNDGSDIPFANPEEFQLLLFYDSGIFIEYTMPLKRVEGNIGMACPSEALINLWLVPAEKTAFYKEMWSSYTTGSPDYAYRLPVEQATQMTFDEFNQTFKESNDACLETPLTIWPEH